MFHEGACDVVCSNLAHRHDLRELGYAVCDNEDEAEDLLSFWE